MPLHPLLLSVQVALSATALVLVVGIGLALLISRARFPGKPLLEAAVALPLVLPPTVVGYALLWLLGRGGILGSLDLVFTWGAAVIASSVVALPLMVWSAEAAISAVDRDLEDAARTMGSSEWRIIALVTLPLASRGIAAGVILAFARSLGEFGATLMVAGNIPGRTQTVPLAIYSAVLSNDSQQATAWVVLMTAAGFAVVLMANRLRRILGGV